MGQREHMNKYPRWSWKHIYGPMPSWLQQHTNRYIRRHTREYLRNNDDTPSDISKAIRGQDLWRWV